jgi:calcineurin-like phosphoesterase family protein
MKEYNTALDSDDAVYFLGDYCVSKEIHTLMKWMNK